MTEECPDCGQLCTVQISGVPPQRVLYSKIGKRLDEHYHDTVACVNYLKTSQLETMEALAWAVYLDGREKSPRMFEEWKKLWARRKVEVPDGAWETP